MEQQELIQSIHFRRFNNAEFTNYMTRFVGHVDEAGNDKLGITAPELKAFKDDIARMIELNKHNTARVETAQMIALDAERDTLVRYIYTQVDNSRNSPLADQREAAEHLYPIVKPYGQIHIAPVQQETQLVRGLLNDLRKTELATYVTALQLTPALDSLATKNDAYDALVQQRSNAEAANVMENSKTVRARMETDYRRMEAKAQAWSLAQPSAEASRFVSQLNNTMLEVISLNRQRLAAAKQTPTPPVPPQP